MPSHGHPAPPDAHREYRRLLAAGVNPHTATILTGYSYAEERGRRKAKARTARRARRMKECDCGLTVTASNYARHRRSLDHSRAVA